MYILTVNAFGDFDCPYESIVCCCADKHMVQNVRHALNRHCANHPKVDMDVKLSTDLKAAHSGVYLALCEVVSEDIADKIYAKLEEICNSESVYIYDNIFEVQEILDI